MSRQYPDDLDIEYFNKWVAHNITHLTQNDREMNFLTVAEFTRSIAFYLSLIQTSIDTDKWLQDRLFETYSDITEMRLHDQDSWIFALHQEKLIDTLKYIVEYHEENGWIDPSLQDVITGTSKVWNLPKRWQSNFPG